MVTKLTSSIDSIVHKSNLTPLDVVKFSDNPCKYFQFRTRLGEMRGFQNISETPKMSKFLDGENKSVVQEGLPDGPLTA